MLFIKYESGPQFNMNLFIKYETSYKKSKIVHNDYLIIIVLLRRIGEPSYL